MPLGGNSGISGDKKFARRGVDFNFEKEEKKKKKEGETVKKRRRSLLREVFFFRCSLFVIRKENPID